MTPLQIIGKGPRFTDPVRQLPRHFQERIAVVDFTTVRCPYCGAFNRLPLTTD